MGITMSEMPYESKSQNHSPDLSGNDDIEEKMLDDDYVENSTMSIGTSANLKI